MFVPAGPDSLPAVRQHAQRGALQRGQQLRESRGGGGAVGAAAEDDRREGRCGGEGGSCGSSCRG